MIYRQELLRKQIASVLHNEPLQALTTTTNRLHTGLDLSEIDSIAAELRQVAHDIRKICVELQPAALTKSLEWMARGIVRDFRDQNAHMEVVLDLQLKNPARPAERIKFAIYNILTESLNNIHQHACAERITICLEYTHQHVLLRIADDGVGYDLPEHSLNYSIKSKHFGVTDMFLWARCVDGSLSIRPNRPHGTVLILEIPISTNVAVSS